MIRDLLLRLGEWIARRTVEVLDDEDDDAS
jgi:hypothetical protein